MRRILFLLGFALFSIGAIHAQRTVTGTVTDENGEVLIGAAVQVKGTTKGVITDFDGNYSVEVPSGSDVLVYSYIGYVTQEVELGASNVVDVQLQPDTKVLEEVVVVGYGQTAREQLVGSVGKVESEAIQNVPIASFDQILQGQTPGLVILGGSGQPGSTAGYDLIRGPGSITGGSGPLYIMDGVPISGATFSALNPNDIENVTVLKDASATAIYGSRGANGVIVVTSKQGSADNVRYNYSGYYGVADWTTGEFDMMNSTQKLDFERRAQRGAGWIYDPSNPSAPENGEAILDSLRGINTNWRDVLFQEGKTNSHTLSAQGGNQQTTFYLSGQYFDQEGQFDESYITRGTLKFNIQHQASDNVKVGLNTSMGYRESAFITAENGVNLNNPFAYAYLANPYEQVWLDEEEGIYQFGATGRNPFEDVALNDNTSERFAGTGALSLEIKFLKDFKFRTLNSLNFTGTNGDRYISGESRLGLTVTGNQGSLSRSRGEGWTYVSSNTLEWTKRFGEEHRLNILGGQEWVSSRSESFNFTGYGVDPDIKTPAGITPGTGSNGFIPTVGGGKAKTNLGSFFGRVDYTLKDRYNVSAGVRRDGSSVFGENFRWGTFYNAGVSWVLSREAFLDQSNVINYLKLYANFGTVGSDLGIGSYQYLGAFNNTVYNGVRGIIPDPNSPRNDDLKWEVSEQLNFGVEYGLWNDRINGEVALYRNNTKDLFIRQQLSRTTGSTSLEINAGEMRNQGIEFSLNADVIQNRDITWSVGGNFSYNDNEVTSLGQVDEQESGTGIIREGLPLGTHYVVGWAGVDPATGDPLYLDLNQNVTTLYADANSLAIFGTYHPAWSGGVNTSVRYKGLKLSALGIWVAERTLFNNQSFFQENPNFAQFNQFGSMALVDKSGNPLTSAQRDIWLEPGDVAIHQRLGTARQFSSKDLEDGSYFRLRNVQLSYTLPQSLLGNVLNNAEIYVQGQNLLTITDFTGFDPEISNNIAQYEYPAQKTYTVGINIGF